MIRALALASVAATVAFGSASAPARLGVGAREFHLVLSRPSVRAGRILIELDNEGQDVHDLRIRRIGGTHVYAFPVTKPGGRAVLEVTLRPGRYRLWCSVADHAQLGMRAVLRVRH